MFQIFSKVANPGKCRKLGVWDHKWQNVAKSISYNPKKHSKKMTDWIFGKVKTFYCIAYLIAHTKCWTYQKICRIHWRHKPEVSCTISISTGARPWGHQAAHSERARDDSQYQHGTTHVRGQCPDPHGGTSNGMEWWIARLYYYINCLLWIDIALDKPVD
jgi:hypothetical protein